MSYNFRLGSGWTPSHLSARILKVIAAETSLSLVTADGPHLFYLPVFCWSNPALMGDCLSGKVKVKTSFIYRVWDAERKSSTASGFMKRLKSRRSVGVVEFEARVDFLVFFRWNFPPAAQMSPWVSAVCSGKLQFGHFVWQYVSLAVASEREEATTTAALTENREA